MRFESKLHEILVQRCNRGLAATMPSEKLPCNARSVAHLRGSQISILLIGWFLWGTCSLASFFGGCLPPRTMLTGFPALSGDASFTVRAKNQQTGFVEDFFKREIFEMTNVTRPQVLRPRHKQVCSELDGALHKQRTHEPNTGIS